MFLLKAESSDADLRSSFLDLAEDVQVTYYVAQVAVEVTASPHLDHLHVVTLPLFWCLPGDLVLKELWLLTLSK